ncbi:MULTISPECIES: hypothetical protein [unclassified Sedimentibacter]|uniref:hypothetical protein n=1 Tax=unclassified Sedimentibacter TaxID=2649220 RepID=UPI0027E09522|nr:hypothetical protein [Sedimentibacter sp. MB35-C1]WMJ78815.1 hypothetical protein RBQ61_07775 [Sedimentibacter sp. MB35-C1]
MNQIRKRIIEYILIGSVGVILFVIAAILGFEDSAWSGMGAGLAAVSAVRLVQLYRYKNNEDYAEKINIENSDERNRFLAEKARGMTFVYSIIIEAVAVVAFRFLGHSEASTFIGFLICIQLVIYWLSYIWLKKKY